MRKWLKPRIQPWWQKRITLDSRLKGYMYTVSTWIFIANIPLMNRNLRSPDFWTTQPKAQASLLFCLTTTLLIPSFLDDPNTQRPCVHHAARPSGAAFLLHLSWRRRALWPGPPQARPGWIKPRSCWRWSWGMVAKKTTWKRSAEIYQILSK